MHIFSFLTCLEFGLILAISDLELWQSYKANYTKIYQDAKEDHKRFLIFQENLRTIEKHNEKYNIGITKYSMGINKFADLSKEEFVSKRLSLNTYHSPLMEKPFKQNNNNDLPISVDWTTLGAVTEVKDQGDCGAGWAFATIGSLESQVFLINNTLLNLSVQYLIDCDNITISNFNDGCDGGNPTYAMNFVKYQGIPEEANYPYKEKQEDCRSVELFLKTLTNTHRTTMDENTLMNSVANGGPVAVQLDATNFHLYDGGIFDDTKCSMTVTNHAGLVVGYGINEYDHSYWLVKNSWGPDWGEFGYIRMARGFNQCGVATDTVYPEI